MKLHLFSTSAALALTLLISGCESDGSVSARAHEKSATYAALKPWQKKYVDTGSITEGFTPEMVYIAMGKPDKVEPKTPSEAKAELWTYDRFYQHADAAHGFEHVKTEADSDYPSQRVSKEANSSGSVQPATSRNSLANSSNLSGSMEPADLRSYTVKVLFKNGKVSRVSADQNL